MGQAGSCGSSITCVPVATDCEPSTDTIKIDWSQVRGIGPIPEKENDAMALLQRYNPPKQPSAESDIWRWLSEGPKDDESNKAMLSVEQRRHREERLRQDLEAARSREQAKQQTVLAEIVRCRREERAALERLRARERERHLEEARRERRELEHRQVIMDQEAFERMNEFLVRNSFRGGVRDGKRKLLMTTYPLHQAVKQRMADMVEVLIRHGADLTQQDSAGLTPAQLAQRLDKRGSHADVLKALGVDLAGAVRDGKVSRMGGA